MNMCNDKPQNAVLIHKTYDLFLFNTIIIFLCSKLKSEEDRLRLNPFSNLHLNMWIVGLFNYLLLATKVKLY